MNSLICDSHSLFCWIKRTTSPMSVAPELKCTPDTGAPDTMVSTLNDSGISSPGASVVSSQKMDDIVKGQEKPIKPKRKLSCRLEDDEEGTSARTRKRHAPPGSNETVLPIERTQTVNPDERVLANEGAQTGHATPMVAYPTVPVVVFPYSNLVEYFQQMERIGLMTTLMWMGFYGSVPATPTWTPHQQAPIDNRSPLSSPGFVHNEPNQPQPSNGLPGNLPDGVYHEEVQSTTSTTISDTNGETTVL